MIWCHTRLLFSQWRTNAVHASHAFASSRRAIRARDPATFPRCSWRIVAASRHDRQAFDRVAFWRNPNAVSVRDRATMASCVLCADERQVSSVCHAMYATCHCAILQWIPLVHFLGMKTSKKTGATEDQGTRGVEPGKSLYLHFTTRLVFV
jgi:hypothetical protein